MPVGEQGDGKVLYLGPDCGNLLELVSVRRDDDEEIVIFATRRRRTYEVFLREGRAMMARKNSYGRSTAGVQLTDDVLDQMAGEAKAGLEVTKLRRRPDRPAMGSGPAVTLPVRLDPELRKALDERAGTEKTTASEVIREALRRYLRAG